MVKTGKTDLYRYYNVEEALLYVGISWDAETRRSGHKKTKWFNDIARMTIEEFRTREEAEIAEKKAISTEAPLHNVIGNEARNPRKPLMSYRTLLEKDVASIESKDKINHEELITLIFSECMKIGSIKKWAEKYKVSRSYITNIFNGKYPPNKKLGAVLGYEQEWDLKKLQAS